MSKFYDGFENISVKLIDFAGNDLARRVVMFGNLAEFYEGTHEYSEDNPECIKIVNEIIEGKTFPKYAFEGHKLAFQVNDISRVCLAQFTREKGFFCSASSGVRPLTQEFVTPKSIYRRKDWMQKLENIQDQIEDLYIEMLEAGIPFIDARYFGLHAQTISICYTAEMMQWLRSCNTRTENNIADEINYIYRLMLHELRKAIDEQVTDKLSRKLWDWLLTFADKKKWFSNHTFNNDFERFKTPEDHVWEEPAHNDWRKSGWRYELEHMYHNRPELLLPGEEEMIAKWMSTEGELPSTYDENYEKCPEQSIKQMDYYLTRKRAQNEAV